MGKGRFALTAGQSARGRPATPEEDKNWKIAPTEMPELVQGLGREARKEWNRIERYLIALDRVSAIDRQAMTAYCTQWGKFARIMKEELADESTPLYGDGPTCLVIHPLIPPLARSAKAIIKLAGQFGMTARTRDLESDHGNRKASALKRLMGNQRKIAEGKVPQSVIPILPTWTEFDMAPPFWMSDRAVMEFEELGKQLGAIDLFTPLDLVPICVVCCLFDLYLRAGEQMGGLYTYVTDKEGEEQYVKEHPLLRVQTELHDVMQFIWKDYGQTPRYRKIFNGERKADKKEIPLVFKGASA